MFASFNPTASAGFGASQGVQPGWQDWAANTAASTQGSDYSGLSGMLRRLQDNARRQASGVAGQPGDPAMFSGSPNFHTSNLDAYDARLNPYSGPGGKWSATQLAQLMAENGILSGMYNPLGSKPVMDQYEQFGRGNTIDAMGTAEGQANLRGLTPEQAAFARTIAGLGAQSQGARGLSDLRMQSGQENRQRLDMILGDLFGYNFTEKQNQGGMNAGDVLASIAGTGIGAFTGGLGNRLGGGRTR